MPGLEVETLKKDTVPEYEQPSVPIYSASYTLLQTHKTFGTRNRKISAYVIIRLLGVTILQTRGQLEEICGI